MPRRVRKIRTTNVGWPTTNVGWPGASQPPARPDPGVTLYFVHRSGVMQGPARGLVFARSAGRRIVDCVLSKVSWHREEANK